MRIAAVGDVHLGTESRGLFRPALTGLARRADVLLLAGDLTRCGTVAEAQVVAEEFSGLGLPVVAVLGNHDHHNDEPDQVADVLRESGIVVLEGNSVTLTSRGVSLGIAGTIGFGGGFAGRSGSAFGERMMRDFIGRTTALAESLHSALQHLDTDITVAMTHYSPVTDTLRGEPPEIFPFLGSYLLAEAIDSAGADLAVHGHAHAGTEHGATPGGIRVRNVAQPVIRSAYALYRIDPKTKDKSGLEEGEELAGWGAPARLPAPSRPEPR